MTIDDQGMASPRVSQFATGFEGGVDLERAPNGDLVYVSFGDERGHRLRTADRLRQNRAPVARATATPSQGARAARRDAERRGLE